MEARIGRKRNNSTDKSGTVYKWILLVIGELVLLLFVSLLMRLLDSSLAANWFQDTLGECIVYGTPLVVLLISGLIPDFLNSFVYDLKQEEEITAVQVGKSLLSVKLAMTAAVVANLLVLVYSFVSMMANLYTASDLENTLPISLAVWGGSGIHCILVVIILLPIAARLKVKLISMDER